MKTILYSFETNENVSASSTTEMDFHTCEGSLMVAIKLYR